MPKGKYVRKAVATEAESSVAYDKKLSSLVSKIERLENLLRKIVATEAESSVAYDKKLSSLVSKIERLENLLIASTKISHFLAQEVEILNNKYGL